jgi:hypothetical protein
MLEVFASDVETDASSMKGLGNLRAYLLELRNAIKARLEGKKEFAAPSPNDVRMAIFRASPIWRLTTPLKKTALSRT